MPYTRHLKRTGSTVDQTVEGARVLLDYEFDALPPEHDRPMLSGAGDALRKFVADAIVRD